MRVSQYHRLRAVGAFALIGLAIAGATPAHAQERDAVNRESTYSAAGEARSTLTTAHQISLQDAASLAKELELDVVGYRVGQPGIEGEVFPSSDYSIAQYEEDFRAYVGTDPAIVGVIVIDETKATLAEQSLRPPKATTSKLHSEVLRASADLPRFSPAPANRSEESLAAKERLVSASSLTKARERAATESLAGSSSFSPPDEMWAPQITQIAAVENLNGDAVVLMTSTWTGDQFSGSRPGAMPSDWGMEFEVFQINNDLHGTRPFCVGVDDEFWGEHDINSWAFIVDGAWYSNQAYGSYYDGADASDPCSRSTLTIGVGYPNLIPSDAGGATVQTMVITDRGNNAISTKFGSYYQAVSNDCNNVSLAPGSNCMDLNSNRSFPGPGGKILMVVNQNREWELPNCIFTNQATATAPASVVQVPELIPNGCWY